jgi:hypothetical protein
MVDTGRRLKKLEQSSTDTGGEDTIIRVIWSDEDDDLVTDDDQVIYVTWTDDDEIQVTTSED